MQVLEPGQEEVVRRIVACDQPTSYRLAQARIADRDIVARYFDRERAAWVEVRLTRSDDASKSARTKLFAAALRASSLGPAERALFSSILAAARAHEGELRWTDTGDDPRGIDAEPTFDRPRGEAPSPGTDAPVTGASVWLAESREHAALAEPLRTFFELEKLGRWHEALRGLDEARETFGRPWPLAAAAAWLRARAFDFDGAAKAAREALASSEASLAARLTAADALLVGGHHDEARAVVASLDLDAPNAPNVRRDLAALLEAVGDFERAEAMQRRLLEAAPEAVAPRLALARLRAWSGDARQAEEHARAILELEPGLVEAHGLVGLAKLLAGELEASLAALEKAGETEPTFAVARAEVLLRLGRLDEARVACLRACELTTEWTNHVPALVVRAAIHARLGRPEPAEPVLAEAMATLSPSAPEDFERALAALGGNRSSTPTFVVDGSLRAVRTRPSARLASKHALWKLALTADLDEAMRDFDRVHEAHPAAPEPWNYRGEAWLYFGDAARAADSFRRALALNERSRWAFIGLGGAALLEDRPTEALDVLQRGVELGGGAGPTTFVYRGEALRRLGRLDEAKADLEHAVLTNPSRLGAWVNLALAQEARGDAAGLAKSWAEIRTRAPGFFDDAGAEESTAALARMLLMLRGNRSSTCVTYFTDAGALRVVPSPR